ncbi:MAG: hypothetical protein IPK58_04375 [Acidobacteria bacterium]|nr:hypothetical protein [Acidobacteriota bacterium]
MFIPGRIEFLGKHTDYCGGESIVCPISRGFHFEFESVADLTVTLENRDSGETLSFDLADPRKRFGWINYCACRGQQSSRNRRFPRQHRQ